MGITHCHAWKHWHTAAGDGRYQADQARWDGDTLVMHAGPELDVRGGSVRLWRLASNGTELIEDVLNRGLGLRFDFKEASIPKLYTRDRHVYVRRLK